jgi:hypothetical protein
MARTIKIAIMDVSNIIGPGLGRVKEKLRPWEWPE